MKALSVKQPWANMITCGDKTVETRTWSTNYRGELLIVASNNIDKRIAPRYLAAFGVQPQGKAIAIVELVDCRLMRKEDESLAVYPHKSGLYAWVLKNIRKIIPFPVRGRFGLYEVEITKQE